MKKGNDLDQRWDGMGESEARDWSLGAWDPGLLPLKRRRTGGTRDSFSKTRNEGRETSPKKIIAFVTVQILSFISKKVIWTAPIFALRKLISIGTAIVFAWSVCITPVMAETINVQGGSIDVNVQDNITNWNVTGNPVWNMSEFNVAQGSIYNIAGLGSGASLALLVNGGSVSNIFGTMNLSNLAFILQNIAGINIGSSAMINLNSASLIASTLPLNLSMTDFLKRDYQFSGQGGFLSNAGRITGHDAALVALIANAIENRGTIEVPMGTVVLAAGKTVTVGISPDGMVSIGVDEATANAMGLTDQIKNSGTISAQGGRVVLNAKAVDGLFDKAINIDSGENATAAVVADDGKIEFVADGDISNTGTLQAKRGSITIDATGDVETQGVLKAGTITERGASFKMGGLISAGHLYMDNLDNAVDIMAGLQIDVDVFSDIANINVLGNFSILRDVTIQTDSDGLNDDGTLTWSSAYTLTGNNHNLTLKVSKNSTIGAITGVNTLTLDKNTGKTPTYTGSVLNDISVNTLKTVYGVTFSKAVGDGSSGNPYLIYSVSNAAGGLQYIPTQGLSSKYYRLANNIDASETSSWTSGFSPIGTSASPFSGSTFDGNGKTISGLTINTTSSKDKQYAGLFGYISGATIQNVGLTGVSINAAFAGNLFLGALVGFSKDSTINGTYSTGSVTGTVTSGLAYVGGLVGTVQALTASTTSKVSNSYSTATVAASASGNSSGAYAGGLVGWEYANATSAIATIVDAYATGTVSAMVTSGTTTTAYAGGLLGWLQKVIGTTTVSNDIATGVATASGATTNYAGGMLGFNTAATVGTSNCGWYNATNTVTTGNRAFTTGKGASASVYFSPLHTVYTAGTAWDITTTPVWDTYTDSLPHLRFENYTGATPNGVWSGATSTDWNTASNWFAGMVPGTSAIIFILERATHNPVITDPLTVNNLRLISGSVTQNGALIITGTFTMSGGTFNNNAAITFPGNNLSLGAGTTFNQNVAMTLSSYTLSGGTFNQNAAFSATSFTLSSGSFVSDPTKSFSPGNFVFSGGTLYRFSGAGTALNPYMIYDVYGLQGMKDYLSSVFKLANNIDASSTSTWNFVSGTTYSGFAPIGNSTTKFMGTLDGDTKTVSGLYINRSATSNIGLFGYTSGATIKNIGLVGGSVTGYYYVGSLVGYNVSSSITSSYATGSVSGDSYVGGLVGYNKSSTITSSYATGSVGSYATGRPGGGVGGGVGGLVGYNNSSSITSSYTTGIVNGVFWVGGLVGYNDSSSIVSSHATGNVTGENDVGGLVGNNNDSPITSSYATGNVIARGGWGALPYGSTGGLVGYSYGDFTIADSYATGTVLGPQPVGGFVGQNYFTTYRNCYATGDVSGDAMVGGFVGFDYFGVYQNISASGKVNGLTPWGSVGALVGLDVSGVYENAFYNITNNPNLRGVGDSLSLTSEGAFVESKGPESGIKGMDVAELEAWRDEMRAQPQEDEPVAPPSDPQREVARDESLQKWRNFAASFASERAMKLDTQVNVREGAVYVLDRTNEMALLRQGESMRVNFKQALAENKIKPSDVMWNPAKFVAAQAGSREDASAAGRYGTLQHTGKDVFYRIPGGEWKAAKDGMTIMPGDEVRTAAGATVKVLLSGGSVGQVEIKEGSLFRINKAEIDAVTGDKTTLLDLAIGKILVKVQSLKGKSRFEVKTPTALTGVRGTIFEVTVKEKAS